MSLTFNPPVLRPGATVLAIYVGTPLRSVAWVLTGPGAIVPLSAYTDALGVAAAKVTPVAQGDAVTVTVTAGA